MGYLAFLLALGLVSLAASCQGPEPAREEGFTCEDKLQATTDAARDALDALSICVHQLKSAELRCESQVEQ